MRIIIAITVILGLVWAVNRDIKLEKQYTDDLRNRVVGSRLQADGKLPYFYKWKPEDGLRYYDFRNIDEYRVANITASPFFHQLITPLTNYDQHKISKIWLMLEYFTLIVLTLITLRTTNKLYQRCIVVIIGVLLVFTEAWKIHVSVGQNYLIMPLVASFLFLCLKNKSNYSLVLGGVIAGGLLLLRPNSAFFLLPFLLLVNRLEKKQLLLLFSGITVLFFSYFQSTFNRELWREYFSSISEQIKLHQGLGPEMRDPVKDTVTHWEGIDNTQISVYRNAPLVKLYYENGNAFILINKAFNTKVNHQFLMLASVAIAIFVMLLMYLKFRNSELENVFLIGFALYMISDIFSPIIRHQYNTVQLFFPTLLAAALYNSRYKVTYGIMFFGILLSILHIQFIKMEHTIGEYLIVAALLWLGLNYKKEENLPSIIKAEKQ